MMNDPLLLTNSFSNAIQETALLNIVRIKDDVRLLQISNLVNGGWNLVYQIHFD